MRRCHSSPSNLTRADVHLRDESAGRSTGDDHRCLLEACPSRPESVVVMNYGASVEVDGALVKMQHPMTSKFGRAQSHEKGGSTMTDHLRSL